MSHDHYPYSDSIGCPICQAEKEADASHAARCARNHTKYSSYTVDVVLNVGGCETECRADVYFEYTPEEPRGWNYPGCPASAELRHVRVGALDVLPLMSAEAVRELEESLV